MTKSNFTKWREYLWYYAPFIFWIIIIFAGSSDRAAMSETSLYVRPVLTFLFPAWDETALQIAHGYVRKMGHLTFYGVLGWFAARAFCHALKNSRHLLQFGTAWLSVVIVAALDETNQSFLASRTGSVYDVALDAIGGLTAILLYYIFNKLNAPRPKAKTLYC